jgi:hypothetical protein
VKINEITGKNSEIRELNIDKSALENKVKEVETQKQ